MYNELDVFCASEAAKYFPEINIFDRALLEQIPSEFKLIVPHIKQKTPFSGGAACAEMLLSFHNLSFFRSNIEKKFSYAGSSELNHETYSEDFARDLLDYGLIPYHYFPGRFILPAFQTGADGADFIASNYEVITPFNQLLIRSALYHTKSPVMIRLHFTTDEYEMPESDAHKLDTAGHPVIITGYDNSGFFVNDPWDSRWGGFGGGSRYITYERLISEGPSVNCCRDFIGVYLPVRGRILAPRMAVYQGREIRIDVEFREPELVNFLQGYFPYEVSSTVSSESFSISSKFATKSQPEFNGFTRYSVAAMCPQEPGSYAIDAQLIATGTFPVRPWERKLRKAKDFNIIRDLKTRLDVKDIDWLNRYGRV